MQWTEGYVTEVGYTHGYYRELAPSMMRLACLSQGFDAPPYDGCRYLELGFGQGLSLNVHAAAYSGEFWGTDFNPAHATQASAWARASGAALQVLDASFEELLERDDLPEYDFIALHGVWSWIAPNNRAAIVELARKRLAVGGLLYISYNTTPGWAPMVPMRHLMQLHAQLAGAEAVGMPARINEAIAFSQRLVDLQAGYFRANPSANERLKGLANLDRAYLAHEYFNRDWHPMPFSDVAEALSEAKLTFVASSHLLDHIDAINLSTEGQKVLAELNHPVLRQSVRDYLVNQYFRRDIFVKGGRRLTPGEVEQAWRDSAFVLTSQIDDIPMTVQGALGQANLSENFYRPLLAALSEGGGAPKRVSELLEHPALGGVNLPQMREAVLVLTGAGHLFPAQTASSAARARCHRLNAHLLNRARSTGDVNFLVSPVMGAGLMVSRIPQLFLDAWVAGETEAPQIARAVWQVLQSQGQRLIQEGKTLETPEENVAELQRQAELFLSRRLPTLKALMIA